MGLRQALMALMEWATNVPQKKGKHPWMGFKSPSHTITTLDKSGQER